MFLRKPFSLLFYVELSAYCFIAYLLYSLYFAYTNIVDRLLVSNLKSNGLDSSVNSRLDAETNERANWTELDFIKKRNNWTEAEAVSDEFSIPAKGQISGLDLLNVSDFIKEHNHNVSHLKS